jgi:citrate synthase
MPDLGHWKTSVTRIADSVIAYRDQPIAKVIEEAELSSALWLVLFGREATPGGVDALRRAIIAALDHGVAAPSTLAARVTASTRGPLPLALAAGLIAFAGPAHGGAAEGAANLFQKIAAAGGDTAAATNSIVGAMLDAGERVPGYGHPYHSHDPRVAPLMAGLEPNRTHRDIAEAVERCVLARTGKSLPMNADAAVGALLLDAGLTAAEVTLITALGRAFGLAAHAREERTFEKPFRAPALSTVQFTSPAAAEKAR